MMRQSGKQILTKRDQLSALLMALVVVCAGSSVLAANSRLDAAYVTDPLSGVALGGYDPLSYFTHGEPKPGRSDFEYYWQGVSWYFNNAANRDAFARAPEIYAPQFGGYGTMSMARGFLSDGNPLVYEVLDNRLYLFYSTGNHQAFMAANHMARWQAMEKWKVLAANLPRP